MIHGVSAPQGRWTLEADPESLPPVGSAGAGRSADHWPAK
jgi:hypothetical protein